MNRDDLEVHAPLIERNPDGSLSRFIMPAPLTRGGYQVRVRYADYDRLGEPAFIVLRGAMARSSHRDGMNLMEIAVHGQSDWRDDEGDLIKVAALQLVVGTTDFLYDTVHVDAYMGEPGANDYTTFAADCGEKALPYWPRNRGRHAPEVASRGTVPQAPTLVRVVLIPEWDTPVLPEADEVETAGSET